MDNPQDLLNQASEKRAAMHQLEAEARDLEKTAERARVEIESAAHELDKQAAKRSLEGDDQSDYDAAELSRQADDLRRQAY